MSDKLSYLADSDLLRCPRCLRCLRYLRCLRCPHCLHCLLSAPFYR